MVCIFFIWTIAIASCHKANLTQTLSEDYVYQKPVQTDDGWEVTSLTNVAMNQQPLVQMMSTIHKTSDHRIHSLLVIKDGKLVFEEYFPGHAFDTNQISSEGPWIQYDRETLHFMASVTKSVTSVIFGIAVDQNIITDVHAPVREYYPSYPSIWIDQKSAITIRHLLSMSAGLAWDENSYNYNDIRNDIRGMFASSDPIKYILERNLESSPGTRFHYNSGYANILADVVRISGDMNLKEIGERHLFNPLKILNYRWDMIRSNYVFASGGLYMRPRDLAKIGQLYLNGGVWQNQRLISPEWITESVQSYINPGYTNFANGYGYQWWLYTFQNGSKSYPCYMAIGWGDQLMYVFPAEKLVIVTTGGYFFTNATLTAHSLVNNYILKAL